MQIPEPDGAKDGSIRPPTRLTPTPKRPATQGQTKTRRPKRQTFTIGFRVDSSDLARLEAGASRVGLSVHEYARVRLLELLDREEESHLVEEAQRTQRTVERMGENLDLLRGDVALTLEILLLNLTQGDPHQIRGWIDAHLRNRKTGNQQSQGGEE